jgi:menaquinone-dependent protoporphyrinogen oxidase
MRVLVVVSSRHGATADYGEAIADVLRERGIEADVFRPPAAPDPAGFDAVVVGSAVYTGHWMADAREWVERNAGTLRTRPLWLFSSGPVGDPPLPDADGAVTLGDLPERVGAREHRVFPGRLERRRLGFVERALVRAVHAEEGDSRDWPAVEAWTSRIADALSPVHD